MKMRWFKSLPFVFHYIVPKFYEKYEKKENRKIYFEKPVFSLTSFAPSFPFTPRRLIAG